MPFSLISSLSPINISAPFLSTLANNRTYIHQNICAGDAGTAEYAEVDAAAEGVGKAMPTCDIDG